MLSEKDTCGCLTGGRAALGGGGGGGARGGGGGGGAGMLRPSDTCRR